MSKPKMMEDELLKWKFRLGSREALSRIYEKYLNTLLTLAIGLTNDVHVAEDIVQEVFVSFAKRGEDFRLRGSLKSYLVTCVINRVRDHIRAGKRRAGRLEDAACSRPDCDSPDQEIIFNEQSQQANLAMARLPYEQREVIVLRLKSEMKFEQIASLQNVSVSTVQGRYHYGLNKLRSILNGR